MNTKVFNDRFMKAFCFTKIQQLSKLKRKCRRVKELVDLFDKRGGCALAMYILIFTLENASHEEWTDLIKDLRGQLELVTFCLSLQVSFNDSRIICNGCCFV